MKQLILTRHATAQPEQFPGKDFERKLSESGVTESKLLGNFLTGKGVEPELLLTSSALRTLGTAEILKDTAGWNQVELKSFILLYNAGFQQILNYIKEVPPQISRLMLVAHNPGISQLATVLSADHPYQFPTAGCLCLEFPFGEWNSLATGSGIEKWYFNP